jgi:hypothetical protein
LATTLLTEGLDLAQAILILEWIPRLFDESKRSGAFMLISWS